MDAYWVLGARCWMFAINSPQPFYSGNMDAYWVLGARCWMFAINSPQLFYSGNMDVYWVLGARRWMFAINSPQPIPRAPAFLQYSWTVPRFEYKKTT